MNDIDKHIADGRERDERVRQVARELARVLVTESERGVDPGDASGEDRINAADEDEGFVDRVLSELTDTHAESTRPERALERFASD